MPPRRDRQDSLIARRAPKARYGDLAAFTERDPSVAQRPSRCVLRTFEHLRPIMVVELGSWESMLWELLDQLEDDAGSARRALVLLNMSVQSGLEAWLDSPSRGMEASTRWLAAQAREASGQPGRGRMFEDYADLAESARSFRLRGDGLLEGARLRSSYTIELRRSWLKMVGDLLGQVVADAGSCERAATVLAVPEPRLAEWVLWLVSGGDAAAARSLWPLMAPGRVDSTTPYSDLADAVLRGALASDSDDPLVVVPLAQIKDVYRVRFGPWKEMVNDLLEQISADAGSVRKAARALNMANSTLSAKLRRVRAR